MNASEAQELADALTAGAPDWGYTPLGVKRNSNDAHQWLVLYEAGKADGTRFDGPVVVIVDERDGRARFQRT
jgi:hypothetical protein